MQRGRTRAGFTLLEMVIAFSVLAILAGVAIPAFSNARSQGALHTTARKLVADFRYVRGFVASSPSFMDATQTNTIAHYGGVRFDSPTQYSLFVDGDSVPGNESVVRIVTLNPLSNVQVLQPSSWPTYVYFTSNGRLAQGQPAADVVLTDTIRPRTERISLTLGGNVYLR